VSKLQQHLNSNTAPFIQAAALRTFDLDLGFLKTYNDRLKNNLDYLAEAVTKTPALHLVPSVGGLFAFVDISGTSLTSDAFASGLLEATKVATTPGSMFGRTWDSHIRISLAIEHDRFRNGVDRLTGWLKSGCEVAF
jgi:aspartate/methionine/tyrosine aminotransferase